MKYIKTLIISIVSINTNAGSENTVQIGRLDRVADCCSGQLKLATVL